MNNSNNDLKENNLDNKETTAEKPSQVNKNIFWILGLLIVIIIWLIVKPGIFTVQPIGAIPEGVTFIYHSRNPEMPFFGSPDGLCLEMQGSVSLLCRATAMSAVNELTDRIIVKLPYMHWAYLISTGGLEFDQ
jgi:hypothetical protein